MSLSLRSIRKTKSLAAAGIVALALTGCVSSSADRDLPRGEAAYTAINQAALTRPQSYLVGPNDLLQIKTFNEPGLSFDEMPVDLDGRFSFPFIGQVQAAGRSSYELEDEIERRLNERYTRNAQVTIIVKSAAGNIFTVEGDVNRPGAFEYAGPTSLLQAIARAESPTRTAKLTEIVVFRVVGNERYGGVFNLNDIREGRVADPAILPGDTIFVGFSAVRTAWREFLQISPVLNAFSRF